MSGGHPMPVSLRRSVKRLIGRLSGGDTPSRIVSFRDAGDLARDAGRWSDAAKLYQRHLEASPEDIDIRMQLGHALKEAGDYLEAEAAYNVVAASQPCNPEPYLHLGHLKKVAGQNSAAADFYQKASQLGCEEAELHSPSPLSRLQPPKQAQPSEPTAEAASVQPKQSISEMVKLAGPIRVLKSSASHSDGGPLLSREQLLKDLRQDEKRQAEQMGYFNPTWYAENYPDVAISSLSPWQHFNRIGWWLGRNPSKEFNVQRYQTENPDVLEAGVNPLIHYLRFGKREGRPVYDDAGRRQTQEPSWSLGQHFGPAPWVGEARTSEFLLELQKDAASGKVDHLSDKLRNIALEKIATVTPPTISVVMPTWNRSHVVLDALRSALSQSFAPLEVLLIDDGSTDDTIAVVSEHYKEEISSGIIKILKSDHRGVSHARNVGLSRAVGDVITYLDSDNTWRQDYLLLVAAQFADFDELNSVYFALSHNDLDVGVSRLQAQPYDRARLLGANFIDLNVFAHKRALYEQLGGFDESLKRLVDWDLIIRYTKLYEPLFVPYVGVDYFLSTANLSNITKTVSLDENRNAVLKKHIAERLRYGLETPAIGYILWDWPALSQTFVLSEIRTLVEQGHDVKVYWHVEPDNSAKLDFHVESYKVDNAEELAYLLAEHGRNICHTHFAYPAATLLAWPACKRAGIRFTIFAHAVDIFHENNVKRNRIAEIVDDPLCVKLFVHGDYHRNFLRSLGVREDKIAYCFQAVEIKDFSSIVAKPWPSAGLRGVFIGRFVEKKGLDILLEAAATLTDLDISFDIYGYGPMGEHIEKRIGELCLGNVKLCGPLSGVDAVREVLDKADFVVVPSIVAENGDTEGFPTIIFEAMAARRPVITSAVASVPNYLTDGLDSLIATPGVPGELAEKIRRLNEMESDERSAIVERAHSFTVTETGATRTLTTYFSAWTETPIELVLVTYNTAEYDDADVTEEILRRILTHTTLPYNLTLIDNGSDKAFRDRLKEIARDRGNVRLILLRQNRFVGPATNLANAYSNATYSIYLCSKEGFVARHGWEVPLVRSMDASPGAALGGYLCHLPKYTLGSELAQHPQFGQFRNKTFATDNPGRAFLHVQGGVLVMRRSAVRRWGGFSHDIPQGGTDVEFSYFMESNGEQLLAIEGVASLTIKTIPKLDSIADDVTLVAHPIDLCTVESLERAAGGLGNRCNICGVWDTLTDADICNNCDSSGSERAIYKEIAHNWRGHRAGKALLLGASEGMASVLGQRQYKVERESPRQETEYDLIVSSRELMLHEIVDATSFLSGNGMLIVPSRSYKPGSLDIQGFKISLVAPTGRTFRPNFTPLLKIERV